MNLIDNLNNIESTFVFVKQVGQDGEALTKITKKTIEDMKIVIAMFEQGMQSETWSSNLIAYAGEEGAILAQTIYQIFKETMAKIEAL